MKIALQISIVLIALAACIASGNSRCTAAQEAVGSTGAVTQSEVYWCPMRGRPCAEMDYPGAGACKDCGMALITKASYQKMAEERAVNQKTVGVVLFTGFEVLDVYGPIEMWGYVKEFKIVTIAEAAGPVRSTQGLSTVADYTFADSPPLDILMVPGGIGTRRELDNPAMIGFIQSASETAALVTSVCTGSALLAKAGVLDGHRATTNKRFFEVAASQSDKVTWVESARWVEDGKFVTSSGVSAGTDMALGVIRNLYGDERARQIAAGAEYTWNDDPDQDPFARK